MWNILFVLIHYVLARAAGILAKFCPVKEFELSDVEKNFFDPNFFAQSSIGVLKKAFEVFFGTTTRSIFFRSSAYLFIAALTCLAMLLVKYVGAVELVKFVRNGFAEQLQPDEYESAKTAVGNAFDRMLTPDRFAHVAYPVFVTGGFFIFAYAVLSACTAVVVVGLYHFLQWFSSGRISGASVAYRLALLLSLAVLADLSFVSVLVGTPIFLAQLPNIRPFEVADVQLFQRPDGEKKILVYSVGVAIRPPEMLHISYQFRLGLGPIDPSEISKPGRLRPFLEEHFGTTFLLKSTEAFCLEAHLTDRWDCIRRLIDVSFSRFYDVPADFWRGALADLSGRAGQAICLDTEVAPSDFPPSARLLFASYMPLVMTLLFEAALGAVIVPTVYCLYLLNRLFVRAGRQQIVRSERGLELMSKYGSTFLALPILLLLTGLHLARATYCGG